ncbi:MAG: hypothetical protein ACI4AI_03175 [Paludibacteraceae bacterium]
METLTKLIEKLSSYQILNYLIPGSVFCVLLKHLVGYDIIHFSIVENVIICYFVGMVNNRLGSLILYPLLKKTKFIKEADYADFVKAEKKDSKVTILSDINNVFRSFANVMLLLLCALGTKNIDSISNFIVNNISWIAIISLFVLFLFSVCKQTKFVRDRVDANKE